MPRVQRARQPHHKPFCSDYQLDNEQLPAKIGVVAYAFGPPVADFVGSGHSISQTINTDTQGIRLPS